MAVDDVSFFRVTGEEVSRSILVQQMIDFYQAKLVVGETKVTDFNEGSEIRNLLESFAVDIYTLMEEDDDVTRICFVDTADGEWLDKHGANPWMNLPRELGEPSTGIVTFTIPETTTSEVVIPADTVLVSEDTGLQYVTIVDSIISVGDTTVNCMVECLTEGTDGDAESNTVTLFDDDTQLYPGLSVTNPDAFTGGVDYEEDDEYRERLLAYKQRDDFGSIPYYESLCESVEGVHDVALVDVTGYTKKVLVNGTVKPTPTTVLTSVLEELSNPNNVVLNHTFTVDVPSYVSVGLTVNLGVTEILDESELEELVYAVFDGGEAIDGAIFDGLNIGEGLSRTTLYDSFDLIESVETIEILSDGEALSDLSVNPGEVLKVDSVTFNQTIIS